MGGGRRSVDTSTVPGGKREHKELWIVVDKTDSTDTLGSSSHHRPHYDQ